MKSEIIKAIFTNLLFVIGVALTIVGFARGALTITRLAIFEEYPLETYEESRCTSAPLRPSPQEGESQEYNKQWEQNCKEEIEKQREIKKFEDVVNSTTMLVAGVALTFTFKKYILK